MSQILTILIERDDMEEIEAQELINAAIAELEELVSYGQTVCPSSFMSEWFGLEPDYIDELLSI